MTVQNIEKQLIKLDVNSRARLATFLLSSLDDLTDEENEKLWAKLHKEELVENWNRVHKDMPIKKIKPLE